MKFICICSLWLLSGCSFFYNPPAILQINSQQWTSSEFAQLLAHKILVLNIRDLQNKKLINKLKSELITDLLIKNLVKTWAKKHSLVISQKQLKSLEQKIKNSYPSNAIFELSFNKKKISKALWKDNLKYTLLNKKVKQHIVSSVSQPSLKEIQKYYKNHPQLFQQEAQILIHHIFYTQKEELIKLRSSLKQNKNLIIKAKSLIINPVKIESSRWIKKGTLKVFDKAFNLKINQISPIWSSPYGYHIIQLLNKKSALKIPFKKAQLKIKKKLLIHRKEALFLKWLDTESRKIIFLQNKEALKKIKVKLL